MVHLALPQPLITHQSSPMRHYQSGFRSAPAFKSHRKCKVADPISHAIVTRLTGLELPKGFSVWQLELIVPVTPSTEHRCSQSSVAA